MLKYVYNLVTLLVTMHLHDITDLVLLTTLSGPRKDNKWKPHWGVIHVLADEQKCQSFFSPIFRLTSFCTSFTVNKEYPLIYHHLHSYCFNEKNVIHFHSVFRLSMHRSRSSSSPEKRNSKHKLRLHYTVANQKN